MIRKKSTAFVLVLLLFFQGIRYASASEIREFIRCLGSEQPLCYELTAEFGKLPQFDETRTEKLNLLIRHLSFHGFLDSEKAALTVSVDDADLFSVFQIQTSTDGETQTILSTDPNHSYTIPGRTPGEQISGLSFLNVFGDISEQTNIYFSLETFAGFFEYLLDTFQEKCGSVGILEKYKDYGTAVSRINLRLDADELSACIHDYSKELPMFSGIPDLRKLIFSGRQDFEFLVTEEGKIMKIRYGGMTGYSEEDLRTVRLEWKTVRNTSVERDELSLRTPNKDASRRNNFLLEHEWRISDEGKESFSWKAETDVLEEGIRTRGMIQCSAETDQDHLSGSFSETVAEKGLNTGKEVLFEVSCSQVDQYSGILEIISKKDKIESGRLKIGFILSKDIPFVSEADIPEPINVSEEEYSGIIQKLISAFLSELLKLPAEDLVFLTEGIPEELFNDILLNHATVKESAP